MTALATLTVRFASVAAFVGVVCWAASLVGGGS